MKRKLFMIVVAIVLLFQLQPIVSKADELKGLTLEKELREMIARGIIKGNANGQIFPKREVNRQEFAAFLARTMKLPNETPNFTDVNSSSAVAGEIGAMQKTNIMRGTTDGKFLPTKLMSREEMAVTMKRALDYLSITPNGSAIELTDQSLFKSAEGIPSAKIIFAANIMNGTKVNASRTVVTFNPSGISKRDEVAAVLSRFIAFTESAGGTPSPPTEPPKPVEPPTPAPDQFQLAVVSNGSLIPSGTIYKSYTEAVAALGKNASAHGIYKGKDLIRIKSGQAFAKGPAGIVTTVYETPTFSKQLTYTEAGRELRILEYNENYVKVQVADTVGYAKISQVNFQPTVISDARDYYIVNAGNDLLHYTYNYLTKKHAAYTVGPAPSFLAKNTRYYSADGVLFLNGSGQGVGIHHSYFQFQSVRSKSTYSEVELDQYIIRMLKDRETLGGAYKDASTKSKLIGLGSYLKQMETQHRVNALFILATAVHESNYGMSANAQTKNNLFGIRVFDSTPEAGEMYATPQRSVEAFVLEYMNKNYAMPAGAYAKGAAPGNKTAGFNAHYASDPTWGAKIAGHMYRMDKELGGRDYRQHRLAMTNQSGNLNVRKEPVVRTDTLLFSYAPRSLGRSGLTGYPVAIVEQQKGADGYIWYKVFADDMKRDADGNLIEYGWIRGDLLNEITDMN